jgi:glycosyltransferase involved in cell wall biosynthesis
MKKMKISVCIPSIYPDLLKLCISSLKVQTENPHEILIYKKKGSRAKARNWLLKKAKGDLIVLTDDDVIFPPNTLEKIRKFFTKHRDKQVVQGSIIDNFFRKDEKEKVWEVNYLDTIICVLRKEVAKKVLMDEKDLILENLSLGEELKKLGIKLWMTNAFYVYHLPKDYDHYYGSVVRNTISQLNRAILQKNIKYLVSLFFVPLKNAAKLLSIEYSGICRGIKEYIKGERKARQY